MNIDHLDDRDWTVANVTVLDGITEGDGFVAAVTDRNGRKFVAIRLGVPVGGAVPPCALLDVMDLRELQRALAQAAAAHGGSRPDTFGVVSW